MGGGRKYEYKIYIPRLHPYYIPAKAYAVGRAISATYFKIPSNAQEPKTNKMNIGHPFTKSK